MNRGVTNGERITEIYKNWALLGESATLEQKEEIGILYLTCILSLQLETAQAYVVGDVKAMLLVREANPQNDKLEEFWQGVRRIFSQGYNNEDIALLIKAGKSLPFSLITQLSTPRAAKEPLFLRRLVVA